MDNLRPAATVILVRDGSAGLETLLLRRNSGVEFNGGAWVFPGGRLDPVDYVDGVVPVDPRDDANESAARVGAARETQEESGLIVAPEAMVPFSHWTTPAMMPKRYATWFFLCAAPEGEVTVDGSEITEHVWIEPAQAIAARDAGELQLAPPTHVSLLRLTASSTVAEAMVEAARADYERYEPHIRVIPDGFVSILPGDIAYDDEDRFDEAGPRHRLWVGPPPWRYERD